MENEYAWLKRWTIEQIEKGINNTNWALQSVDLDEEGLKNANNLLTVLKNELEARKAEPTYDPR
jgi:hypothetical protein